MKYLGSKEATDETIDNVYGVLVLLESVSSSGGLNVGDSWCPSSCQVPNEITHLIRNRKKIK